MMMPGDENESRRVRWVVLAAFTLCSVNQSLIWGTFNASPDAVEKYYKWDGDSDATKVTLDLLLNWGPISYVVVVWFVMICMSRGDPAALWWLSLCGTVLSFAGSAIRLIPTVAGTAEKGSAKLFLHFGQFLNGCSGPMWAATPSALSSLWFEPEQRMLATGISYVGSILGPTLGLFIGRYIRTASQVPGLLFAECALTIFATAAWMFCPKVPAVAPSKSCAAKFDTFRATGATPWRECAIRLYHDVKGVCGRDFAMLSISGGLITGVFNCWTANLPLILQNSISSGLSNWLGVVGNLACVVGTVTLSAIQERCFKSKLKRIIIGCFAVQFIFYAIFCLSLPIGTITSKAIIPTNAAILLASLAIASAGVGASSPAFYELGAEITFPAHEEISAGLISFLNNAGGMVLLSLLSTIAQNWDSLLVVITVLISAALMFAVNEKYARRNLDQSDSAVVREQRESMKTPLLF